MAERGLGLIQKGSISACVKPPWLFSRHLSDLDRYCVEAAIYVKDCINTTAATANVHITSPYEVFVGKLPPPNTLVKVLVGFLQNPRTHKSEPKIERCFYANKGRNHPPDCFKDSHGVLPN